MPGFHLVVRCRACQSEQALTTGFGDGWEFEQFVCHRCATVCSVPVGEDIVPGACTACGLQLERWPRSATGEVPRPCPRCLDPQGLDTVIERTAWS